jgi:hypothetical protein
MEGVSEERFKELMYHQEASIRYERMKARNSCARTLIFALFLLLSFIKFFLCPFFAFLI